MYREDLILNSNIHYIQFILIAPREDIIIMDEE
jgi:hypothetical protein